METNKPYLFIELNEKNFIFLAVKYDENFNFEVLHSVFAQSDGIHNGIVLDTEISTKIIKDNLDIVEKKINFIFKSATIIITHNNFDCINISGFKRLNGAQVLEENVSYILNNLKKIVLDNQPEKYLVHLFNSNFILDNKSLKNPPIGLHGDFYNHHLTFFLLPKNDFKNLKNLLNNCNLNLDRIILKPLTIGLDKLLNNKDKNNFAIIHFGKKQSNISIFNNLSFVYSENFDFGTDIIMKDVSKVCSLSFENVKKIFFEMDFDEIKQKATEEKYLDKKFFVENNFRKISINLLNEIINARVEELINLILKKNINLKISNEKIETTYFSFDDLNFIDIFKQKFLKTNSDKMLIKFEEKTQDEQLTSCLISAELIGRGWEREAIPTVQTKKSIIARLFSIFFK